MTRSIKTIAAVLAVCGVTTAYAAAKVTLTGKAQSCHPGRPIRLVGVGGVDISAFRVSSVPSLLVYLKAFDSTAQANTITTEAMMMRLDTLSTKAYRNARSSKALARTVSDSLGAFKLRIPVTDSVLIYALGHDEDDTFGQVYTTMSGRANRSFILDMEHGGCSP